MQLCSMFFILCISICLQIIFCCLAPKPFQLKVPEISQGHVLNPNDVVPHIPGEKGGKLCRKRKKSASEVSEFTKKNAQNVNFLADFLSFINVFLSFCHHIFLFIYLMADIACLSSENQAVFSGSFHRARV